MKFLKSPYRAKKENAFTLAETLITIMVIGVVAAIMIPALSYLIQAKIREHQVEVAKQKFNRAAEMMMLNGKMGPYYSDTKEFVDELQNHLKISKVCRVGSSPSALPPITNCFGDNYETITINTDGDTVNLSDIKTATDFGIDKEDEKNEWTSDNIGILTIDGTRMILAYNSKCPYVEPGVYLGNSASSCIAGVADVDGDKKPNTLYKDVYLFGSAESLGQGCIGKSLGLCLTSAISVLDLVSSQNPMPASECVALDSTLGFSSYNLKGICNQHKSGTLQSSWYARMAEKCGHMDNILSLEDAIKIVNYIYGDNVAPTSRNGQYTITFTDEMAERAIALGLPDLREQSGSGSHISIMTNGFETVGSDYETLYMAIYKDKVKLTTTNTYSNTYDTIGYLYCKSN